MMARRPRSPGPDCTCPDCRAAATRMARMILTGSTVAWALIAAGILTLFA